MIPTRATAVGRTQRSRLQIILLQGLDELTGLAVVPDQTEQGLPEAAQPERRKTDAECG